MKRRDSGKGRKKSDLESVGFVNGDLRAGSRSPLGSQETLRATPEVQLPSLACQPKQYWVRVDELCELFDTLDIYHKPGTYPIARTITSLKSAGSPLDRTPTESHCLFVDSLQQCEVIVSLSAITTWPAPEGKPLPTRSSKAAGEEVVCRSEEKAAQPISESPSPLSQNTSDDGLTATSPPIASTASLVIQTQYWLRPQLGEPVKQMEVQGSRAVSMVLSPGRYTFKLNIFAPLGFTITVLGTLWPTGASVLADQLPGGEPCAVLEAASSSARTSTPQSSRRQRTSSAMSINHQRSNCGSPVGGTKNTRPPLTVLIGDEDAIIAEGISTYPLRFRKLADQLVAELNQVASFMATITDSSQPQIVEDMAAVDRDMECSPQANTGLQDLEGKLRDLADFLHQFGISENLSPINTERDLNFKAILRVINTPLKDTLRQYLSQEDCKITATADMNFAWRVLNLDLTSGPPFSVNYRKDAATISAATAVSGTGKAKIKVNSTRSEKVTKSSRKEVVGFDSNKWSQPVEPNVLRSVVRIQAAFRGFRIRRAIWLCRPQNIFTVAQGLCRAQLEYEGLPSEQASQCKRVSPNQSEPNTVILRHRLAQAKRLTLGFKKCIDVLQVGHLNNMIGVSVIMSLLKAGTSASLASDLENFIDYFDYSGKVDEIPIPACMTNTARLLDGQVDKQSKKKWLLIIFRGIFGLRRLTNEATGPKERTPKILFPIRFNSTLEDRRLVIVNNDTGRMLRPYATQPVLWFAARPNNHGYTILGLVNEAPTSAGHSWRLRFARSGLEQGRENVIDLAPSTICTNFVVTELADYYVPNTECLLMRRQINIGYDQLLSIHLRVSDPDVTVNLVIRSGKEVIQQTNGIGEACLLAVLLPGSKTHQPSDATDSKDSNKKDQHSRLKKSGIISRGVSPSSRRIRRSIKEGTSSSQSGSSRSGSRSSSRKAEISTSVSNSNQNVPVDLDQSAGVHKTDQQSESNEEKTYWLEAHIAANSWPLSFRNWNFINEQRRSRLADFLVYGNQPTPSGKHGAAKAGSGSRSNKQNSFSTSPSSASTRKSKQISSKKAAISFDFTQAHWRMRIISDAASAKDIKIADADDRASAVRLLKQAWEEMEPGRAERAALSRSRYLEQQAEKLKTVSKAQTSTSDVEVTSSLSPHVASSDPDEVVASVESEDSKAETDPTSVYTFELPESLKSVVSNVAPIEPQDYMRKPDEVEHERILAAIKKLGIHWDSDCLGDAYKEQVDPHATFQDSFRQWMTRWEQTQNEIKLQQADERRNQISILRSLQLTTNQVRAKYHEACEVHHQAILQEGMQADEETAAWLQPVTATPPPSVTRKESSSKSGKERKSRSASGKRKK